MQKIAERLKCLRERENLTQTAAANALGIGVDAYKNYETARRTIPADILRNAAVFYGITMDYLCALTDIPYALKDEDDKLARLYYTLEEADKQRIQERMLTMHEYYKSHRTLRDRK